MMREEQLQQELASMYQFTEKRSAISGLLLSNATRDFSFAVLSFRRASNSIRISTLMWKRRSSVALMAASSRYCRNTVLLEKETSLRVPSNIGGL